MQSKGNLKIKLKPHDQVMVKMGDLIKPEDIIIRIKKQETKKFNLAKLLKVPPRTFTKYLKSTPGKTIAAGEIIAEKKSLLGKQIIKSPITGKLSVIDPNQGIVGIDYAQEEVDIKAWFNGQVVSIEKDQITLHVAGRSIQGTEGFATSVAGKLVIFTHEDPINKLDTGIENCVVAVKKAHAALIAKADALGATAIVAEEIEQPPFELPYLLVTDINHLHPFQGKLVMILGDDKELIVVN